MRNKQAITNKINIIPSESIIVLGETIVSIIQETGGGFIFFH